MTGPPRGAERGRSARTGPFRSAADQDREKRDRPTGKAFESAAEMAVVERIREAARTAAPAPTTDEIAELLGCESLSTPVAVLRRLQLRGFFVFESYQKGRRFWLPDGRSTAPASCSSPPWRWRDQEAANG